MLLLIVLMLPTMCIGFGLVFQEITKVTPPVTWEDGAVAMATPSVFTDGERPRQDR